MEVERRQASRLLVDFLDGIEPGEPTVLLAARPFKPFVAPGHHRG